MIICSSIKNWRAYANDANIANKDCPIADVKQGMRSITSYQISMYTRFADPLCGLGVSLELKLKFKARFGRQNISSLITSFLDVCAF